MFEFMKKRKTRPTEASVVPIVKSKTKGKIFIVDKPGDMLPGFSFAKKSSELGSKQLTKEQTEWLTQHGLIDRPYSPSSFILLRDRCPVLGGAIDCIANDVSSTGWSLMLKEGVEQSIATDAEHKALDVFLNKPNPDDSLKELISACITDMQTIGDFSLEIVRSREGKIAQVFHIPAHTIWRNKDKNRFAQKRNTKIVFFVPFNSGIVASSKTGKEKEQDLKTKANELIFKKLYNSESGFYGRSPMLSCTGAVVTSIACEEYNQVFFENAGIPAYAVLLTGEWDEGSVKLLSTFMTKELRGVDNQHKTIVFQCPEGGKAEFKPLQTEAKEGSFRLYAQDLDDKILGVYKVPRCKVSIQKVGKLSSSDTAESLRNYNDSVVEPMQNIVEDVFNNKLLPGVLGAETHFNFKLNNLHIDDFAAKTDSLVKLLERACITPNQVIARLSLGKEYPAGNKYFIASTLIEAGEQETEDKVSKAIEHFDYVEDLSNVDTD